MKNTVQTVFVLFLALCAPIGAFSAAQKSSALTYFDQLHKQGKERVVVLFENKADLALLKKYDAELIHNLKSINALVCVIEHENIEMLKQEDGVKDVVPDMVVRIPTPPQPEMETGEIGALSYDGSVTVRWNNLEAGLNTKAAWDRYGLDGTGIKIAFIDTGVNYTMENLDDHYLGGYDFWNDDDDPINDTVDEKHGTEVVSLAVGEGVNKVVGVAYNASYYVLKAGTVGNPPVGYTSDIMAGIEWASTEPHKADIISISWRIHILDPSQQEDFERICNNAYNQGIIIVAGSGNEGYSYSGYPAAFDNVISVGMHAEDQSIDSYSNGGVDIVAPGARVYSVHPDNSAWWVGGTSFATPHAAALLALQLQYARQRGIEINNAYLWEVMKHGAKDLGLDPVFQGEGKIYAAQTDANDPNIGSIDLIASNWPIDYDLEFSDYAFYDSNIPAYHIGSDVNQAITLTNITNILGNTTETIENLTVSVKQVYYNDPNEPNLPGDSVEVFPTISRFYPADGNSVTLSLSYRIPPDMGPGLVQTKLALQFNFLGNSRVIRVCYHQPNLLWYAAIPGDLDLSNSVDMTDLSIFAQRWQNNGCADPDYCHRADIDRSGEVDWNDVSALADNWLRN